MSKLENSSPITEFIVNSLGSVGIFFKALRRNKSGMVGFIGLLFFFLMIVFGPLIIPFDGEVRIDQIAAPPGSRIQLITLAENADRYKTLDDLKGKTVAFNAAGRAQTRSEEMLEPYLERGEINPIRVELETTHPNLCNPDGTPKNPDDTLATRICAPPPLGQVLEAVRSGEADAALLFSELVDQHIGNYEGVVVSNPKIGPAHWLGTDTQGRDILSHIVNGGETLILTALLAGFFSTLIAVGLGALAGLMGGPIDRALTASANFVLTIPAFPLLVVLAALLGDKLSNFVLLAALIAGLSWPVLMRAIRSQVLSLREREFVEAARALDLGLPHIIMREILPNMMSFVSISFIFAVTGAMYQQIGLVFLGMVPISEANYTWGVMLFFGRTRGALFSTDSASMVLSPVIAIALFQVCMVLFARALEEMFDPRLRTS